MAKATAKKKAAAKKASAPATPGSTGDGKSRYKYEKRDAKTPSGRVVTDCGDTVAAALRGMDLKEVLSVCKDNGVEINSAWSKIHPGRGKMAASNVLRGMVRRGEPVKIGGKKITSLAA